MNRDDSPAGREDLRPFSIIGLGTIVVDHMVAVDGFPERDTKNEISEHWFQVGGPVPTALAAVNRLGGRSAFLGRWANDHLGAMIEEDLRAEGIAFDAPACEADSQTGFAHVWVERDSGRRTSVFHRGSHEIEESGFDGAELANHDALHLDGWSTAAAIKAARAMRAKGGAVFLDLGSPKERLAELLSEVEVVNCPLRCVERVFGETDPVAGARKLIAAGPRLVTVTDGENGAWLVSETTQLHCPAFEIEPVDTNGAGDTFCGALIYAVMQGWDEPRVLRFATAAAALKCGGLGNRAALPDLDAVGGALERSAATVDRISESPSGNCSA